jgi:CRP-like cAMP-binding protein
MSRDKTAPLTMPATELQNRLLSTLTPGNCERLLRDAQLVELPIRMQLFGSEETPRYVYFLRSGVASLVFTSERGTTVELATLGSEGMVGWMSLLGPQTGPIECMMQVAGEGFRLPLSTALREFHECEEFRRRVLEFAQHQTILSNQIVACNRLHRAEARFARWLLMVQDRVHSDTIHMTQEFLSCMLGTRRTTVVEVAGTLERGAAIASRRGLVRIVDRAKLEGFACECYPVLKSHLDDLYAPVR